jgi:hypothetical protein
MTKENSTEIVFVVDRSGSMSSIAADMRGGLDTFIAEQKKLPGECTVSLSQFDDRYETIYAGKPIDSVPPLELVPRGATALLDAVGRTIDAAGARLAAIQESDRPSKILFVIVTDGAENASHEYSRARINEMIKTQQEKYSWEFVFLGANQDAFAAAQDLGIRGAAAMNYVASAKGAQAMYSGLSASARSYRGGQGIGNLQDAYNVASGNATPAPPTDSETNEP